MAILVLKFQLSRIIYLFSSNMHDASLSLSIHTTCARLMLNLVILITSFFLRPIAICAIVNLSNRWSFYFVFWVMHLYFLIFKVEPIFEKGVDQSSMDEARVLLVYILFTAYSYITSCEKLLLHLTCKTGSPWSHKRAAGSIKPQPDQFYSLLNVKLVL